MCCPYRSFRRLICARPIAVLLMLTMLRSAGAQSATPGETAWSTSASPLAWQSARPEFIAVSALSPLLLAQGIAGNPPAVEVCPVQYGPDAETWIEPIGPTPEQSIGPIQGHESMPVPSDGIWIEPHADGPVYIDSCPPDAWFWQVLPDGLIYRSYQAGVHEPRLSVVIYEERDGRDLWDATLGGRVGVLRYGDSNRVRPQGWQLDFEGAAIMRFTLDRARDFDTADYRAGVPITYGIGDWQFKFGYYHLSSHMGDEFIINNPGAIGDRINYVRDALVLGVSYYPHPVWRVYAETAYALKAEGGAEPWEFQFGTELSRPGPTGPRGTPFFAFNGHIREEHDFGGDVTAQTGWLWRGRTDQTMRIGLHYFNGKSSQYQTFDDSEQQIGVGVWYDF